MKKTALIGWNAKRNVGDDAMTLAFIELLRNRTSRVLLVCDKDKESLKFLENFPEIDFSFAPFHKLLGNTKGVKGIYYRWFLSVYLVLTCNEIIIGGGTLFHTSGILRFYRNILKIKKILKLKVLVGAACVSVGPFRDSEAPAHFRAIAKDIDFINVRDQRSYDICKSIIPEKTSFYPDIALSIPSFFDVSVIKENKVSVSLRQGHVGKLEMKWLDDFLNQLHTFYPETQIEFVTFCDLNNFNENDDIAIDRLMKFSNSKWKSKVTRLPYNSDPIEFYQALKKSQFNICMRLHASIISYATDTNFITLNYHQKCEDFFKLVNLNNRYLVKDYNNVSDWSVIINELMQMKIINKSDVSNAIMLSSNHLKPLIND